MSMKKKQIILLSVLMFLKMAIAEATPSQLFWTPCTTDIQSAGVFHLNVNNYFDMSNHCHPHDSIPPDAGLRLGLFTWNDFATDLGFDYYGGVHYPLLFNAKVGITDDKLFSNSPSMSFGIFNAGAGENGRVLRNVINFVVGKDLPEGPNCVGGRIFCGVYAGLTSFKSKNVGGMAGYERGFGMTKHHDGKEYKKWILKGDYASGKNAQGGGGIGLGYYFTPTILLVGGPTWISHNEENGKFKVGIQLQIDI